MKFKTVVLSVALAAVTYASFLPGVASAGSVNQFVTSEWISQEIKSACKDQTTGYSILVRDLKTGQEAYLNPMRQRSASLIKVYILAEAYNLKKQGKLDFNEPVIIHKADQRAWGSLDKVPDGTKVTVRDLLEQMIVVSDNTATNVLIEFLGMDTVNAYCRKLGLKSTVLERKMLDWDAIEQGRNNYTSAEDQLAVFSGLYRSSILTPELCAYALGILKRQRDFSSALRYIADENLSAAHKTGGLDYLNHDAGIFYLPGRDYYFGCFVTDAMDDTEKNEISKKLIGRLSRAVYNYYKEG